MQANVKLEPNTQTVSQTEISSDFNGKFDWTNAKGTKMRGTWEILQSNFDNSVGFIERHSPLFTGGPNGEYKWQMSIDWIGFNTSWSGFTGLMIENEIRMRYCINIITEKSNHSEQLKEFKNFHSGCFKYVLSDSKWRILCGNGTETQSKIGVTIVCEIIIDDGITDIQAEYLSEFYEKLKASQERCSSDILSNLDHMLGVQKFCDVTLITGGREIRAHKAILAAHSPFFKIRFSPKMEGQQENRLDMSDLSAEVVMEMLRFIYTGKTANLNKMAEGLLLAAHKYQLPTLRNLCAEALCKCITTENAPNLLILGHDYGVVNLKTRALDVLCAHPQHVLKSESYKFMRTNRPHLLLDVLEAMATRTALEEKPRKKMKSEN